MAEQEAGGFWDGVLGMVGTVAPGIATALGGPMAGVAVKFLADQLLGEPSATPDAVKAALSGMSHEELAKLQEAERAFMARMRELDIKIFEAEVQDTQGARGANGNNPAIMYLGVGVLVAFVLVCLSTFVLCGFMLAGKVTITDVGVASAVFGLIGTVVGYVSAKADQVIGYFFGSSFGSKQKTEQMGAAFADLAKASATPRLKGARAIDLNL